MKKIKVTITTDNKKYEVTDEIPNSAKFEQYVTTLIKKYKDCDNFLAFMFEGNGNAKALLIDKTKINAIEIESVE